MNIRKRKWLKAQANKKPKVAVIPAPVAEKPTPKTETKKKAPAVKTKPAQRAKTKKTIKKVE